MAIAGIVTLCFYSINPNKHKLCKDGNNCEQGLLGNFFPLNLYIVKIIILSKCMNTKQRKS